MPHPSKRKYFPVITASYVLFLRDGKILLNRRLNTSYHDGDYGLPSGHIEEGEFATEAAIREAKEEVSVDIKPEDLVPAHIMHRHCGDHDRVDFFFVAKQWQGEITNAEPEKCDDLSWFPLDQLPESIIPNIRSVLEHYQAGRFFSEFTETENKIFSNES